MCMYIYIYIYVYVIDNTLCICIYIYIYIVPVGKEAASYAVDSQAETRLSRNCINHLKIYANIA